MIEQPKVTMQAVNLKPRSGRLMDKLAQSKLSLFIALVTGIWLCFTIAFAWALSSQSGALGSFSDPTSSIRILSILSEGVGLSLPALVACTSSIVMWAAANSEKGISVSTWLSISPATTMTGLATLFLWRHVWNARDWHHLWIIARLIFLASVPVLSVLLRSFITTTTVYDPLYTFRASGGIGAYNASYPAFWDPDNIAILASEVSSTVLSSGGGQVLLSHGPGFSSHFLIGGLGFMQPLGEINGGNFPDADSVFAHQQLGVQTDLWDPVSEFVATTSDCKIWGIPLYALMLCIAPAPGNASALIAGVSGCFDDTECFRNLTWTESLDFSVMIAFSQRTADVVYSRASHQITAFSNLSDPIPEIIAPSDLFLGIDAIFGPDYTTTGILADNSSATGNLLYNYIDIFTDYDINEALSINETDTNELGGLLTLPIFMFQATSLNPNPDVDLTQPQVGLAPNLYISVDLSESKLIVVIPKWVVIVYLGISATVYVCCVGAIFLSLPADRPPVSSFEMIDFASKAVSVIDRDEHELESGDNSESFAQILSGLRNGNDKDIQNKLQDKRLFLRDIGPDKVIGFAVMEAERTPRLRIGQ